MDEFGPLNLRPHPGHHWEPSAPGTSNRQPATGNRQPMYPATATEQGHLQTPARGSDLLASYDLSTDRHYGHVKIHERRTQFLAFMRYLRPLSHRIATIMDNVCPHLSTRVDTWAWDCAAANNGKLAYVPFYGSWLNRIEPQFTALR